MSYSKIFLLLLLVCFSCSRVKSRYKFVDLPGSLEEAVHSDSRASQNVERDEFQHPLETLKFFGITSKLTVAEISPGAGYYTEILAPYLAKQGQYVIVVPRLPSNPPQFLIENEKKLQNILLSNPNIQAKAKFIPFEPLSERNKIKRDFVDLVVTFNSVHNWIASDSAPFAFNFFYEVLKPGGILGVVQHRAPVGKKIKPNSGYMTEQAVITLALASGFKFLGKSQINANPKDKANHPGGVWSLPPVYRLGKKDRDKYEDIGESDRMTLKFQK